MPVSAASSRCRRQSIDDAIRSSRFISFSRSACDAISASSTRRARAIRLLRLDSTDLHRYDIGIAVQTEQGLVVPVVHGADKLSLDELDAEVKRLAEGANAGTLKPEELRGGTFTVTSAGKRRGCS